MRWSIQVWVSCFQWTQNVGAGGPHHRSHQLMASSLLHFHWLVKWEKCNGHPWWKPPAPTALYAYSTLEIFWRRRTLFLLTRLTLTLAACHFYIIFLRDVTHCTVSRCAWRSYILIFLSVVFSLLVTSSDFPQNQPVPMVHSNT